MKIKNLIIALSIFFSTKCIAQDIEYSKEIITELSSEKYFGRGYDTIGNLLAAKYISEEIQKMKLQKFKKGYSQKFKLNTNSLFGNIIFISGKDTLKPGSEYIVQGSSGNISGTFKTEILNAEIIKDPKMYREFVKKDFSKKIIVIDTTNLNSKEYKNKYNLISRLNILKAKAIIECSSGGLTYEPSQNQKRFVNILIKKDILYKIKSSVTIKIDAKQLQNVKTQNIIGYIKGDIDSFIVYSAHYDHIGTMGKETFFPGANDNASGIAMLLNLAKYYSGLTKKPKYSTAFMFFSGEELGLLGSKYYTENPLFPLSKIKYLINLDMVGSGDKGIQIVNSAVFRQDYDKIVKINEEKKYLPKIKIRGAAANSDHYFFYAKGVKSFFIYTLGEYKEYHNIYDKVEKLPLTGFSNLLLLLIDFQNNTSN